MWKDDDLQLNAGFITKDPTNHVRSLKATNSLVGVFISELQGQVFALGVQW